MWEEHLVAAILQVQVLMDIGIKFHSDNMGIVAIVSIAETVAIDFNVNLTYFKIKKALERFP